MSSTEVGHVIAVNPATGHQVASIPLGASSTPVRHGLPIGQHASRGYATDGTSVVVIDLDTNTIVERFSAGSNPERLSLSPHGARLFVMNTGANAISVVDTSTQTVTNTIAPPNTPAEMAPSPDGTRLYVLARADLAAVYVANLGTMTVTSTISTDPYPQQFAVHPDGKRLFVVCAGPNAFFLPTPTPTLVVVDTPSGTTIGRLTLSPVTVSLSGGGARPIRADPLTPDTQGRSGNPRHPVNVSYSPPRAVEETVAQGYFSSPSVRHQNRSASVAMSRASDSRSRRSMTSTGECE